MSAAQRKPLYQVVAEGIRAQIASGVLKPGDQLPFKRLLAEQYGVSEQVIDVAMVLLRAEGLVEGQQGKGVFVAERPPS
jgi:DNA-binding GntR family transcriptional regulator